MDGRSLKGLSHHEAAEVLRDAPSFVKLTVLPSSSTGEEVIDHLVADNGVEWP